MDTFQFYPPRGVEPDNWIIQGSAIRPNKWGKMGLGPSTEPDVWLFKKDYKGHELNEESTGIKNFTPQAMPVPVEVAEVLATDENLCPEFYLTTKSLHGREIKN